MNLTCFLSAVFPNRFFINIVVLQNYLEDLLKRLGAMVKYSRKDVSV